MRKLKLNELNRKSLEEYKSSEKVPLVVVLDNIRSAQNVGSIFRTSDGAMIERLYLCGYTPHPPKKEIMKTALGATESVNWEYVEDPKEVILKLKKDGIKIGALELTENSFPHYYLKADSFPLAIIIGNEITGVSQDLLDLCDFSIEIPQYGIKQSLNVAVAYGITIFELRKLFDLS